MLVTVAARDQIGEAKENLDLIEQTAQRMGQIITQLKAFARKAPAELAPVRLSEAIAQAMCLVGTRAHRLGAQVDIDLQPATLLVQAEPIRLGQILINLLSNALDALAALPAAYGVARLAVFGPRPKALAALLQKRGMEANTYSLTDALLKGQVSAQAKTPAPTGAVAAPAPAPESATTTPGDAA